MATYQPYFTYYHFSIKNLKNKFPVKTIPILDFSRSGIISYHQLLKNKWYYVLYSTIIFISLIYKGERQ